MSQVSLTTDKSGEIKTPSKYNSRAGTVTIMLSKNQITADFPMMYSVGDNGLEKYIRYALVRKS